MTAPHTHPAERETPADLGKMTDEQLRSFIGQAHAILRDRERARNAEMRATVSRFDQRASRGREGYPLPAGCFSEDDLDLDGPGV